jgi:hypothetical protein
MQIIWIVIVAFSLWLAFLTFFYWKLLSHYNRLIKGSNTNTLQSVLEELLKDVNVTKKEIDFLKSRCDTIEKDGLSHIQKIGLLRFNPFKDTGGDQSFILALLDGEDKGVVISGLYSRAGTRWYAKKVDSGKGVEYELSDDEKQALKQATHLIGKK